MFFLQLEILNIKGQKFKNFPDFIKMSKIIRDHRKNWI